jgi:hypothetical protein
MTAPNDGVEPGNTGAATAAPRANADAAASSTHSMLLPSPSFLDDTSAATATVLQLTVFGSLATCVVQLSCGVSLYTACVCGWGMTCIH